MSPTLRVRSISGGVYLSETGTVVNAGTMVGNRIQLHRRLCQQRRERPDPVDYGGVSIQGAVGTLVNAGTIDTGSRFETGVDFTHGGYVGNRAGGLITGYAHGVQLGRRRHGGQRRHDPGRRDQRIGL